MCQPPRHPRAHRTGLEPLAVSLHHEPPTEDGETGEGEEDEGPLDEGPQEAEEGDASA